MPVITRSAALVLGASLLSSLPALADEARYNQISLRAEVSQEVPRDLMLVTLYSEEQNADPAKLAAKANAQAPDEMTVVFSTYQSIQVDL